jgi:hypothetical protein
MVNMLAPAADREVTPLDNRPPLISTDELMVDHSAIVARVGELEAEAAAQPHRVNNDDEQGALQDVIKRIDDHSKVIEAKREDVKGPFLTASRIVDGFFKALSEPKRGGTPGRLEIIRNRLAAIGGDYLRRKEAAERLEREQAAARQRAEEQRLRDEAAAAELAAARLRERNRPTAAVEKETVADIRTEQAAHAGARASELETQAAARPAELARTRSALGSLGTLKAEWMHTIEDIDLVPLEMIASYIKREAIEVAVRAFIKARAPTDPKDGQMWDGLPGVKIYGTTKGVFR